MYPSCFFEASNDFPGSCLRAINLISSIYSLKSYLSRSEILLRCCTVLRLVLTRDKALESLCRSATQVSSTVISSSRRLLTIAIFSFALFSLSLSPERSMLYSRSLSHSLVPCKKSSSSSLELMPSTASSSSSETCYISAKASLRPDFLCYLRILFFFFTS